MYRYLMNALLAITLLIVRRLPTIHQHHVNRSRLFHPRKKKKRADDVRKKYFHL